MRAAVSSIFMCRLNEFCIVLAETLTFGDIGDKCSSLAMIFTLIVTCSLSVLLGETDEGLL